MLVTLAVVEAVRSPYLPGDPHLLLTAYLLAGVCAGTAVVLCRERPLLGGTAAVGLLAAAVLPWPQRGGTLLAAGTLAAAVGVTVRRGPATTLRTVGGRRDHRPLGWLRSFGAGVGATFALVALLIVAGWAGEIDRFTAWPLLPAVSHIALGVLAGAVAVAACQQPLVAGLPAVTGALVLAQALPTWIEIPVEAGLGHFVALLVGLLAVATVAGLARRSVGATA